MKSQVTRFAWALMLIGCGNSASQAPSGNGAAGGAGTTCLPRGRPVMLAVSPHSAYYLMVSTNTGTSFDGVFTSTYKKYLVVLSGIISSGTNINLLLQMRVSGQFG